MGLSYLRTLRILEADHMDNSIINSSGKAHDAKEESDKLPHRS
jgi:hypothetical protein